MLKTGVKDGSSQGKSFYVCVDKQGCDFSQVARYSLHPRGDMFPLSPLDTLRRIQRRCPGRSVKDMELKPPQN